MRALFLLLLLFCGIAAADVTGPLTPLGGNSGAGLTSLTLTCPSWMTIAGTNPITTSGSFGCSTNFTPTGFTVARTYTFPDANATVLYSGGPLGTPSSGVGTNLTGVPTSALVNTLLAAQEPAHTGDMHNAAGALATTVVGVNGTLLSGLATGLLKNTTATGVPSIATAGTDYAGLASTNTFTGTNALQATAPTLQWDQSGAGTNLGWWGCGVASGVFICNTLSDAQAAGNNWLAITRGATTVISTIAFGNATNNPAYNFLGTGTVTAGGSFSTTLDYVGRSFTLGTVKSVTTANGMRLSAANTIDFDTNSTSAGQTDSTQHWRLGGTASPSIASGACGATTNGTLSAAANDHAGEIIIGAATTTTCAVTFSSSYATAPRAVLLTPAVGTVAPTVSALSASGFTIAATALASTSFYYWVQ
jgi:hypothetical protein